jgi:ATP-dependent Clp protease adaptor protein ClpS
MSTTTKRKSKSKIDQIKSNPFRLILNNDDKNSFDWVITCLVKICKHEYEQASQVAHIVHYKGKCDIKYGAKEELTEMKDKLRSSGLSVTLVEN